MNQSNNPAIDNMKRYSVVTTDVWDTLIRRSCHPEAIKFQTARIIKSKYAKALQPTSISIEAIYFKRLTIERSQGATSQSQGNDDEYSIYSVFEELLSSITKIQPNHIPDHASELVESEVQTEIENTYPDPSIALTLNKFSKQKVLFLSDFYMPASKLATILTAKNLSSLVPNGFVSCDIGLNKRSGKLFTHLVENEGFSTTDWLHIGDNEHSDYNMPISLGIECHHHFIEAEETKKLNAIGLFHDKDSFFDFACKTLDRTSKIPNDLDSSGEKLTVLFSGFCEFILETYCSDSFEEIAFITREGKFLKEALDHYIQNNLHYSKSNITTVHLEVSRYSLLSSEPFTIERYKNLWSQYGLRGVGKFLTDAGIHCVTINKLVSKYDLRIDEVITDPLNDSRILKLVSDTNFINENLAFSSDRSAYLQAYIESQLKSINGKTLLVDVGWFGTCQDLLEELFPKRKFTGAYLGVRRRSVDSTSKKLAYIFDEPANKPNSKLSRFAEVFEVITSSPYASVTSYGTHDGAVVVKYDENHHDDETSPAIPILQKAILCGIARLSQNIHKSQVDHQDMLARGVSDCLELFQSPPQGLANLYFDSKRHDAFRESIYSDRSRLPGLTNIVKGIYNLEIREEVIFFYKSMQWSEGLKFQIDKLPFYKRWIYRASFRAAQLWKKIR